MDYFDRDKVPNRFPEDILETLVGHSYDFYGVDNHSFCIGSEGSRMALEAVEDPDDGWRSYFGCFATAPVGKIFFGSPVAKVVFKEVRDNHFQGWYLEDVDTGHVWLKVGTDDSNDYYPYFVFDYEPDLSKTVQIAS